MAKRKERTEREEEEGRQGFPFILFTRDTHTQSSTRTTECAQGSGIIKKVDCEASVALRPITNGSIGVSDERLLSTTPHFSFWHDAMEYVFECVRAGSRYVCAHDITSQRVSFRFLFSPFSFLALLPNQRE